MRVTGFSVIVLAMGKALMLGAKDLVGRVTRVGFYWVTD